MKVKTGDIIAFKSQFKLFKPVTWLSYLIRIITKQEYNHTGVIVYVWGIPMVYESMGHGFKSTPLVDRLIGIKGDKISILRRNDDFDKTKFAKEATNMLGHVKYDIKGLFDQLHFAIYKKWKTRTELEAEHSLYCWEATSYLHRESNLFKNWWEIDPDIYFNNDKFTYIFTEEYINDMTFNHLTL